MILNFIKISWISASFVRYINFSFMLNYPNFHSLLYCFHSQIHGFPYFFTLHFPDFFYNNFNIARGLKMVLDKTLVWKDAFIISTSFLLNQNTFYFHLELLVSESKCKFKKKSPGQVYNNTQ